MSPLFLGAGHGFDGKERFAVILGVLHRTSLTFCIDKQ